MVGHRARAALTVRDGSPWASEPWSGVRRLRVRADMRTGFPDVQEVTVRDAFPGVGASVSGVSDGMQGLGSAFSLSFFGGLQWSWVAYALGLSLRRSWARRVEGPAPDDCLLLQEAPQPVLRRSGCSECCCSRRAPPCFSSAFVFRAMSF